MTQRAQQTIRREATVFGVGFITGADVVLRFLPAPPDHGIVFERVDLNGRPRVPATHASLVPRQRRTAIAAQGTQLELVEHVMAALAGLQIDNCLVEVNAPEMPGFDGSCRPVVDCLLAADIEQQPALKPQLRIDESATINADDGGSIIARPFGRPGLTITYLLDYGPKSPIPAQIYTVNITPDTFINQIAFSRTFILESEIEHLKSQGYGARTSARDLLVFSPGGVIDNQVHVEDECARHKILDCVGDFALSGYDIQGYFNAWRTGHNSNHEIMKRLCRKANADFRAA